VRAVTYHQPANHRSRDVDGVARDRLDACEASVEIWQPSSPHQITVAGFATLATAASAASTRAAGASGDSTVEHIL
jgi:hypothetical protein